MSFSNLRVLRVAAGLAVLSAFAVLPIAAQAAESNLEGTLSGGALSNTAPTITPFAATLSGVTQTITTKVGAWEVTDATGSNAGYSVTVAATAPTVGGSAAGAGRGPAGGPSAPPRAGGGGRGGGGASAPAPPPPPPPPPPRARPPGRARPGGHNGSDVEP